MALYNKAVSLSLVRLASAGLIILLLAGCQGGGFGGEDTGPDPGIIDFPIAYVKTPYAFDNNDDVIQPDLADPLYFAEGGDLYIRDRAALSSPETNITLPVTGGQGDVKDVDVNYDGTKLIFSLRLFDPNPDDDDTPRWDLYEYDIPNQQLTKLMDDAVAELGDDVDPHYLPDGRIVFSSNRQSESWKVLGGEDPLLNKPLFSSLDEDEGIQALVLHVVDENGAGASIKQISFNQSHDLDPTVLPNGDILFSRWDNMGPGNGGVNLYRIKPDGTGLEIVYGAHSHNTGTNGTPLQFIQNRVLNSGSVLAIAMPFNQDTVSGGTFGGGDIVGINIGSRLDNGHASATVNTILTDGSPSPGGRYSSFYPLYDGTNRMLVSKGNCTLLVGGQERACIDPYLSNQNAVELPPEYSIMMYDLSGDSEKPVVPIEPGMRITEVVVGGQFRGYPAVAANGVIDNGLEAEKLALLHIRSVYDFDGSFNNLSFYNPTTTATNLAEMASSITNTAVDRPARYLRLVKAVGIPDPDDVLAGSIDLEPEAFGPNRQLGMREILGYVMIEPDGSVITEVPADVAFTIEVLDSEGRRMGPRHDSWMQLRAGEVRHCTGCHSHPTGVAPLPHGRADLEATPVNQGSGVPVASPALPVSLSSTLGTVSALDAVTSETMAQSRYNRCKIDLGCAALPPAASNFKPSVDLVYEDVWSDPLNMNATVNASDSQTYAALQAATEIFAAPDSTPVQRESCLTGWDGRCRIVINYQQHIHPLWEKDRGLNTCINCHTTNNGAQVPAGQLDLTGGISDEEMLHIESYRDLLFEDNRQILNPDLQDETIVVGVDDTVDPPQDILEFVTVAPSISQNGARVSYFMEKLTGTELEAGRDLSTPATAVDYLDHTGFMSADELRLVAEWIDIGAQYFNNPFDLAVPRN
jgi:hypothetical protein